jgi:hypothetical protein
MPGPPPEHPYLRLLKDNPGKRGSASHPSLRAKSNVLRRPSI